MKKKKILFYFIFIIVLISLIVLPNPVDADSGWDSDYSSSSSDWGSSSSDWGSSSSDWSSSSWDDDDYSNSSDGGLFIYIFFIFAMILVIYLRKSSGNTGKYKQTYIQEEKSKIVSEEEIKKIIPDFDLEEFKCIVFEKYKEIQVAWMDFDYDTLRKDCTDELYNMYKSQLKTLELKKQKNVMSCFEQTAFDVVDIEKNNMEISLKVRTTILCYDYVVDKDNKVVDGTSNRKNEYCYEMTFISSIEKSNDNKCPNCGAKLENNNSTVCSYCNSTIINSNNHDWVLSKKEMKFQRKI